MQTTRCVAMRVKSLSRAQRVLMEGSEIRENHVDGDIRVQDPCCIRCQPHVTGAAMDVLHFAARTPTSANQEDHVSMAAHAARRLLKVNANLNVILGVEAMCAVQGIEFRAPLRTSGPCQSAMRTLCADVPTIAQDRDMTPPSDADIAARRARFHAPYHAALEAELRPVRDLHGVAILYDCHAIRSHIPHLFERTLPDFSIGTKLRATCAAQIEDATTAICENAAGCSTVVNARLKRGLDHASLRPACSGHPRKPDGAGAIDISDG